MTVGELQLLIGTSIGVIFSVGGIAFMAFRSTVGRFDRAVEKVETALREGDDRLHERANR